MSVNFKTLLFVALCALALVSSNDNWSLIVYSPQLHGYLKLHTKPADWLTARVTCHNEGAILASPWTGDFTTAVHKLQSTKKHSLPLIFSGVLVTFPEEAYYKGRRLPDALIGVERCGVFLAGGTTGEIDCKLKLPFICFAPNVILPRYAPTPESTTKSTTTSTPKTTPTPIKTTTTTSAPELVTKFTPASLGGTPSCEGSGYEFFDQTGHCYKFHTSPKKWDDAKNTCTVEGANLVVINSDVEAGILISLFGQHPASSLDKSINKFDRDFVLVGIFWNLYDWLTVDGQTIEQAGYAKWWNDAPYDKATYPYGAMYRDGTFNNVNNVARFVFICEKVLV